MITLMYQGFDSCDNRPEVSCFFLSFYLNLFRLFKIDFAID